jgi:CDP-glucose 4,6-dehydratase
MIKDHKFWKNKKVLITGHTGFKGSWLSLVLYFFGAKLYGYSLKPKKNFLFNKINLKKIFKKSIYSDILNSKNFNKKLKDINPEIIFHMAAQPLVVDSYKDPKKTFNINIIGTVNLFEAIRKVPSVRTVVIITTDKVYKIKKNNPFYDENHPLGASDPYGTSKSCVELISESYKYSFFKGRNISISTARAGNVIGGGDYSKNRIVPDYLRALNNDTSLFLRNPNYIRPWQYVLEPIYGYTLLAKLKYISKKENLFDNWNFAPSTKDTVSVKKLVEYFQKSKKNQNKIKILIKKNKQVEKETATLRLNASKAKKILSWKNKYNLKKTIDSILVWNELVKTNSKFNVCIKFVKDYLR